MTSRRLFWPCCVQLVILTCGCNQSTSRDEVAHAFSPNGQMEALVYETNGGAATSFGYEVDLKSVNEGKSNVVAQLYGAVRSEQAYGVNIHWDGNDRLFIDYLKTKTPPQTKLVANVSGRTINVVVRDGMVDTTAPPGGMLYNLRRR